MAVSSSVRKGEVNSSGRRVNIKKSKNSKSNKQSLTSSATSSASSVLSALSRTRHCDRRSGNSVIKSQLVEPNIFSMSLTQLLSSSIATPTATATSTLASSSSSVVDHSVSNEKKDMEGNEERKQNDVIYSQPWKKSDKKSSHNKFCESTKKFFRLSKHKFKLHPNDIKQKLIDCSQSRRSITNLMTDKNQSENNIEQKEERNDDENSSLTSHEMSQSVIEKTQMKNSHPKMKMEEQNCRVNVTKNEEKNNDIESKKSNLNNEYQNDLRRKSSILLNQYVKHEFISSHHSSISTSSSISIERMEEKNNFSGRKDMNNSLNEIDELAYCSPWDLKKSSEKLNTQLSQLKEKRLQSTTKINHQQQQQQYVHTNFNYKVNYREHENDKKIMNHDENDEKNINKNREHIICDEYEGNSSSFLNSTPDTTSTTVTTISTEENLRSSPLSSKENYKREEEEEEELIKNNSTGIQSSNQCQSNNKMEMLNENKRTSSSTSSLCSEKLKQKMKHKEKETKKIRSQKTKKKKKKKYHSNETRKKKDETIEKKNTSSSSSLNHYVSMYDHKQVQSNIVPGKNQIDINDKSISLTTSSVDTPNRMKEDQLCLNYSDQVMNVIRQIANTGISQPTIVLNVCNCCQHQSALDQSSSQNTATNGNNGEYCHNKRINLKEINSNNFKRKDEDEGYDKTWQDEEDLSIESTNYRNGKLICSNNSSQSISPNTSSDSSSSEYQTLQKFPWFAGKVTRRIAELALENENDGSFIVRLSETSVNNLSKNDEFSLSVRSNKSCVHMRITRQDDGQFVLGHCSAPFESIEKVVNYYSKVAVPIRNSRHVRLRPVNATLLIAAANVKATEKISDFYNKKQIQQHQLSPSVIGQNGQTISVLKTNHQQIFNQQQQQPGTNQPTWIITDPNLFLPHSNFTNLENSVQLPSSYQTTAQSNDMNLPLNNSFANDTFSLQKLQQQFPMPGSVGLYPL
ncbi:hypothetical protein SNEBB_006001 [Seison nebaliae]|nr:hypothetical protein SNEBB_006001 [Seison nebaliae]